MYLLNESMSSGCVLTNLWQSVINKHEKVKWKRKSKSTENNTRMLLECRHLIRTVAGLIDWTQLCTGLARTICTHHHHHHQQQQQQNPKLSSNGRTFHVLFLSTGLIWQYINYLIWLLHSLIHSLTHFVHHSFTHSFTHSFIHSFTHFIHSSFICLLSVHSLTRLLNISNSNPQEN